MKNPNASLLDQRVYGGLPSRIGNYGALKGANPTGAGKVTRETAPLAKNAPARVQHPKLNTTPWSTSFAVKRKESGTVKRRSKRQRKG